MSANKNSFSTFFLLMVLMLSTVRSHSGDKF